MKPEFILHSMGLCLTFRWSKALGALACMQEFSFILGDCPQRSGPSLGCKTEHSACQGWSMVWRQLSAIPKVVPEV